VLRVSTLAYNGDCYAIIFTDDCTRIRWSFSFKIKGEAATKVIDFLSYVKTQYHQKVQTLRMDCGKEYGGSKLEAETKKQGIKLEYTAPYTPEQDGVAERSIRTIL